MKIGFIGQGYIGKNYADDFERRGFTVVRYSLEEPYRANKETIKECDIVFIAVPTPTTPEGFDDSIVRDALTLVSQHTIVILKSTIVPGTTARLQQRYPHVTLLYSPEFLSEKTAAHDATHPFANIVGVGIEHETHRIAATRVLELLPSAPHTQLCTATEAELIKYHHNLNGYFQIILSNLVYDAAQTLGARWEPIQDAIEHDPLISGRYAKPVHQSGHPGAQPGRGAGGHCFIKDMAAFRSFYEETLHDDTGLSVFRALEAKNLELLKTTSKDQDLVASVYGTQVGTKTTSRSESEPVQQVSHDTDNSLRAALLALQKRELANPTKNEIVVSNDAAS
jgi:UDP-glucose 6-dehydrogenase